MTFLPRHGYQVGQWEYVWTPNNSHLLGKMLAIQEAVPSPFPTPQNSQTEVSPSVAHILTAHLGEIPNEMESEAPVERTDALADVVSYEHLCAQNYH